MNKVENALILEDELENLREKLNKDIFEIIGDPSDEKYKKLLDISRKLDVIICDYIRIYI